MKSYLDLGYRQLKGFAKRLFSLVGWGVPVPSYKTMWRRIRKLSPCLKMEVVDCSEGAQLALDSSGIKLVNFGDWLRKKWKKSRIWLKLHVTVDVKTQKVVNAIVTTEEAGDSRIGKYVAEILDGGKVKKFFADGAYDVNYIFKELGEKGIEPAIPPRKDASTRRGDPLRRKQVRLIKKAGMDEWADMKSYGKRWSVEIWFSAYKRRFGEKVKATSWKGIVKEILINIHTLNTLYAQRKKPPPE